MAAHVLGPVTLTRTGTADRYVLRSSTGAILEDRAATTEESALLTRLENEDAIRAGLQNAIQNNIAATAQITAVATKADGYAKNPATDLTTVQITSVLKDICSGIVLTSQAILECERQLTGIERLMLGQLDSTAGA